jgi:hypothetical protein
MCCLTYEHDAYLAARKRFPREGKTIRTLNGTEKVIGIDIWRDLVTLLDDSRQRRVVNLLDLRAETEEAIRREAEAAQESTGSGAAAPNASGARTPSGSAAPDDAGVSISDSAPGTPSRRKRRRRRGGGGGGGGDEGGRGE